MKKIALLATAAMLGFASPSQAVVIADGSSGLTFTAFDIATQGTLLASLATPSPALTFNSVFNAAVYRNTLGTLDFYYQVFRTGAGTIGRSEEIEAFTVSDFNGFTVDGFVSAGDPDGAGFFSAAMNNQFDGPGSTTRVGRSEDGNVLQTDFGTNGLLGTENSATYIFRTNATSFNFLGTYGIIDGSTATGLTFMPMAAAAVPEPSTWMMMLMSFGIMGAVMRRRKRLLAFS